MRKIKLIFLYHFLSLFLFAASLQAQELVLVPFKDTASGLSMSFPKGWEILKNSEGLVVEAIEPKNPKDFSRASVNVGFVDTSYDLNTVSDAEWKQVASEIFRQAVPNVQIFSADTFTVDGKRGYEMAGKSTIQGKKIVLAQFYIPHQKKIYIITCASTEAKLDTMRPIFRKVVQSFKL